MSIWWNSLTLAQQVLYCIAIPSTLILLLDLIIALAGGGHNVDMSDTSGLDLDLDIHHGGFDFDLHPDLDVGNSVSDLPSMRLFTVQGIVAFLCIFSWSGIVMYTSVPLSTALLIGALLGIIVMFVIAKLMQLTTKLNHNGTMELKNALGVTGRVYLIIPEAGKGTGKVNLTIQGQLMECDAISRQQQIPTGAFVRVIDLEENCLVVEPVNKEDALCH